MLDQNTDRMWYVIGAVLIGAAIIGGFMFFMPEAFSSVGGMFDDLIGIVNYDPKREEIEGLITEGYIPVATADELDSIRSATSKTYGKGTEWEKEYTGGLGKKYIQVKDIDLSEYSDEGWNPIGTGSSYFRGTYDGGNYVITGLVVNGGDKNYQGLFGRTQGATISNVGIIDNTVTGRQNVGGLVGEANTSTEISNSYATGSVTGKEFVGGLVGRADAGTKISNSYATGSVTGSGTQGRVGGLVGAAASRTTISNSYATGSVTGKNWVGGLVGFANISTTISNSYATGSVKGTSYLGGLVGQIGNNTTINNSYATGSVTGTGFSGGLVSWVDGSTIENSYATGLVTGNSSSGGLVGYTNSSTEISNSYWDTETTGRAKPVSGGTGKSTVDMKKQTTYEGWDFETIWEIDGNDYPTLR